MVGCVGIVIIRNKSRDGDFSDYCLFNCCKEQKYVWQ